MHAGICFDLRQEYLQQGFSAEQAAEFDVIETIVAIEAQLQRHGCSVDRIGNVRQLAAALASGQRWDFVFNLAEGAYGIAREAQVPAVLEAYQIPYVFSDVVTLAITQDKSIAKRIVRDAGLPTAAFMVVEQLRDLEAFTLAFPVFAKPLAEGTSKGINVNSYADSFITLKEKVEHLLRLYQQPVLIETFLPGRELTVGIFGTGENAKAFGVMEILPLENAEQYAYSYENKKEWGKIKYQNVSDEVATQAAQIALQAWRLLRCRDGGRVDLRCDQDGNPQFLEINPIAGLRPGWSDLLLLMEQAGFSYEDCFDLILESFFKRTGLGRSGISSIAVIPAKAGIQ